MTKIDYGIIILFKEEMQYNSTITLGKGICIEIRETFQLNSTN